MLSRLRQGRTLTVAASCVIHAVLIAGVLVAEHWIRSAHASRPPVLPVELVTLAETPPPPPPELIREKERPQPPPKSIARPPKPMEPPPPPPPPKKAPIVTETLPEPRPVEPQPALKPTAAAPAPEPAATPPAAAPRESASAPASPAPAGLPIAAATDPTASGPGQGSPTGKSSGPPSPGGSSGPVVASAPSRDSGATGAITRSARPSGGYQVRPAYPSSARRLGIQGTTLLRVHVLNDGRVGDVVVQQSAGHPDLDQAAAEAVRQWHFEPARRGNDAVAMWVLLPVEFQLK
jgi:protein TonB